MTNIVAYTAAEGVDVRAVFMHGRKRSLVSRLLFGFGGAFVLFTAWMNALLSVYPMGTLVLVLGGVLLLFPWEVVIAAYLMMPLKGQAVRTQDGLPVCFTDNGIIINEHEQMAYSDVIRFGESESFYVLAAKDNHVVLNKPLLINVGHADEFLLLLRERCSNVKWRMKKHG